MLKNSELYKNLFLQRLRTVVLTQIVLARIVKNPNFN